MKPLGYKCRHQHGGCACCDPSGQRAYRLSGKRRDRQQVKRAIASEAPTAFVEARADFEFERNAVKHFIEWLRED